MAGGAMELGYLSSRARGELTMSSRVNSTAKKGGWPGPESNRPLPHKARAQLGTHHVGWMRTVRHRVGSGLDGCTNVFGVQTHGSFLGIFMFRLNLSRDEPEFPDSGWN